MGFTLLNKRMKHDVSTFESVLQNLQKANNQLFDKHAFKVCYYPGSCTSSMLECLETVLSVCKSFLKSMYLSLCVNN